jgi:type IV pilus assembly protein PilY1
MKSAVQLTASLLALAGLLTGPAAQATDVAMLPLKASVLAKPNVIFGLDDSGSMDGEVMLGNNDGAFWWDYNAGTGWDAAGTTHFNSGGAASTQWRKLVYLFPNGTGTGNRVYADSTNDHFAIPPTAEFAFLRSAAYNPIYYDPDVTYVAWSPAYVGSAAVSYSAASTTAAKSHPAYGTGTFNLTTTAAAVTTTDWTFTALPGMRLPGTARVCAATCTDPWPLVSAQGWTADGSNFVVPADTKLRVAMEYWPATYYKQEPCTVDGSTCVSAPDGQTLKRYEITSADTAAMQNFANWWQYYRKRKLMLNAAVGQVLEPMTGLRLGVVRFNSRPSSSTRVTMYDTDASSAASNGRRVAGIFYETNGSGGTPTRETLDRIGEEYMESAGPIQYACQRNNAFIMTDGFANVASPTLPTYDKATWGSGAPYETTYDKSLADIALAYFTTNLRSTLATGKVPTTDTDTNADLHMNTYGLTMGARGLLFTSEDASIPTDASAWTAPTTSRHPSAVDDLWHATINGRGKMYLANSATETALRIQSALTDIVSQTGAQGGVAVSSVNLSSGDSRAYFGTYDPAGWKGDLRAYPIDAATGVVDQSSYQWSAAAQLEARDWTTRIIATGSGSTGMAFTAANVASTVNPSGQYGADADVIDYLRGDRSKEGTSFRTRQSLIGAVVNSEPAVQRAQNVVYVQSGEGMLHAIDTASGTGGKELWAFVPPGVLPNIGATVERGYVFQTQLDGSPTVGPYGGGTLLVAGMGAAGNGFYALDVSSPRDLTEAGLAGKYKWQFPAAGDSTTADKVGQALGKPRIVKAPDGSYVVLVTSGYNSTADGRGRLWMLDASNGNIVHEFDTGAGSLTAEAGLAHVSGYLEDDGKVRYVYGGDLLGNVWRFDLKDKGTPFKLATLKDDAGNAQPMTAVPELVEIENKRVVVIGTGRILDITDFGGSAVHTMYAISDASEGALGTTLTDPRASLVKQSLVADVDSVVEVDWTTKRGWYLDLPAGEHANTQPSVAYGSVGFAANMAGGSDCSASSKLYVLDILTGGFDPDVGYLSTTISDDAMASRVTAVKTTDAPPTKEPDPAKPDECIGGGGIAYIGQNAKGDHECNKGSPGKTIDPAKNSWREIRRQ